VLIVREGIIQPRRISKLIKKKWSSRNIADGVKAIHYIKKLNRFKMLIRLGQ